MAYPIETYLQLSLDELHRRFNTCKHVLRIWLQKKREIIRCLENENYRIEYFNDLDERINTETRELEIIAKAVEILGAPKSSKKRDDDDELNDM